MPSSHHHCAYLSDLAVGKQQPFGSSQHPIGAVPPEAVPAQHVRPKRVRAGRLRVARHRGGPVGAAAGADGRAATHDSVSGVSVRSSSHEVERLIFFFCTLAGSRTS